MNAEQCAKCALVREIEVHEDNSLQCHFLHHKSHTVRPVGEQETKRLSYGKAPKVMDTLKKYMRFCGCLEFESLNVIFCEHFSFSTSLTSFDIFIITVMPCIQILTCKMLFSLTSHFSAIKH